MRSIGPIVARWLGLIDNGERLRVPRLYAHRGAAAERPENTIDAFRRALEVGADALETDVHMSADGHVIVSHDAFAGRMTGVHGEFRRFDLKEIQSWDAGYGFVASDGSRPFAGQGIQIPTLAELLREFPDVEINIDIKQRTPPMVERTLAVIRQCDAEDRVTIASFYREPLVAVRRAGYRGQTAMSRGEIAELAFAPQVLSRIGQKTRHQGGLAPQVLSRIGQKTRHGDGAAFGAMASRFFAGERAQVPVRAGPLRFGSRWFIDKCHALGIAVDFWTIDDPGQARYLLMLGADGIMTDDPAAIVPVFEVFRAGSGAAAFEPSG